MKKLVVANWKMNPESPKAAVELARVVALGVDTSISRKIELVIAPPFPFLGVVARAVGKGIRLCAQDVFWEDSGAYTGEVSSQQLKAEGITYVIIGHSERRMHLGETDEMIQKKVCAALKIGLNVILCVGERERRGADIPQSVGDQIMAGLAGVKKEALKRLIIAYEPVWAISTSSGAGGPDTPDSALRARLYIEKVLTGIYGPRAADEVKIIYGGSVRAGNVFSFISEGQMDGVLVGGVSLNAKEFNTLIRAAVSRAQR